MNTDKYKNTMPYPSRAQFTTTWWYRNGVAVAKRDPGMETEILDPRVGDGIELGACVQESIIDKEAYRAATQAYGAETARLLAQFKHDLFVELDIVGHPKAELLYSKAWDEGHSSGLHDVWLCAEDLVDLIKD